VGNGVALGAAVALAGGVAEGARVTVTEGSGAAVGGVTAHEERKKKKKEKERKRFIGFFGGAE
jgi:hypothetical protein